MQQLWMHGMALPQKLNERKRRAVRGHVRESTRAIGLPDASCSFWHSPRGCRPTLRLPSRS
eukprot:15459107-Alexandrium_andersonii.AAC.1